VEAFSPNDMDKIIERSSMDSFCERMSEIPGARIIYITDGLLRR
jgi:hypothetical protein